jgi:hypothetical protein
LGLNFWSDVGLGVIDEYKPVKMNVAKATMLSTKCCLFLQVLLGRATEDVIVDIDLGREGRANKISRRQVRFSIVTMFIHASKNIFGLIFLS